jgi:hypothetical protein
MHSNFNDAIESDYPSLGTRPQRRKGSFRCPNTPITKSPISLFPRLAPTPIRPPSPPKKITPTHSPPTPAPPTKPIDVYATLARQHLLSIMRDYNSAIFAYTQIVSGKMFTLSGLEEEPGIIPRAINGKGEHLLQCGYLELYNETIFDLLAPPNLGGGNQVWIQGVRTNEIVLSPS